MWKADVCSWSDTLQKTTLHVRLVTQQIMGAAEATNHGSNVALFTAKEIVDLSNKKLSNKEIVEIAEALKNKECVVQTLDIRGALFHQTHHSSPSTHTQQTTKLEKMVLRALQELSNQTRLFKHCTSTVRDFIKHTIHHHQLTHNRQPNWRQWC